MVRVLYRRPNSFFLGNGRLPGASPAEPKEQRAEGTTAPSHQTEPAGRRIRKLLVVARHEGRGSCAEYSVLTSPEDLLKFLRPAITCEPERVVAALRGWDRDDDRELTRGATVDWVFVLGVARVTAEDKWLIIPDPLSDAAVEGELGVVKRGEDLDAAVKSRYMGIVRQPTRRITTQKGATATATSWNWKIPSGSSDWSGETSYSCIRGRYCCGDWNIADGSSGYEPNLLEFPVVVPESAALTWTACEPAARTRPQLPRARRSECAPSLPRNTSESPRRGRYLAGFAEPRSGRTQSANCERANKCWAEVSEASRFPVCALKTSRLWRGLKARVVSGVAARGRETLRRPSQWDGQLHRFRGADRRPLRLERTRRFL